MIRSLFLLLFALPMFSQALEISGGGGITRLINPGLGQLTAAPGQPDVYNTAFAEMWDNFVVPRMIQRVVIDNWDFDRAMDEAQRVTQAIYDKYK